MKKYIVKEGDTLWKISKETGVRLNLLVAANPQIRDPNQLESGSLVLIPEVTKPVGQDAEAPGPVPKTLQQSDAQAGASSKGQEIPPYFGFVWPHVVRQGETWNSIAAKYGISSTQLQHLNPAESVDALTPGTVLYVPALGAMPDGGVAEGQVPTTANSGSWTSEWPDGTGAPLPYSSTPGFPSPSPQQVPGMSGQTQGFQSGIPEYPDEVPLGGAAYSLNPWEGMSRQTGGHGHGGAGLGEAGSEEFTPTPYPAYTGMVQDSYFYHFHQPRAYAGLDTEYPLEFSLDNPWTDDTSPSLWQTEWEEDVEIKHYNMPAKKPSESHGDDD